MRKIYLIRDKDLQKFIHKHSWLVMITIFLLPLFVCACGTSAGSGDDDDSDLFSDAEWRLVTNFDAQAGITFEEGAGTLTIVNNGSNAIDAPSIIHFDTTTGEETSVTISDSDSIAADETFSGTFTYPTDAAAESSDFFGMMFGEYMGGKFFTADEFDDFPLIITEGPSDEPSSELTTLKYAGSPIVPKNGTWDFTMTGDSSSLSGTNCPAGTGGLMTSGEGNFTLSCDGNSADLLIDDQYVSFYFSSGGDGQYVSPDYYFPVRDEEDNIVYGTNDFNLTPSTTEAMTGELNWDNSLGCSATYPITMAYDTALSVDVNDICEGSWSLDYSGSITCGLDILFVELMSFGPQSLTTLSTTDLPTGVPLAVNLTTGSAPMFLIRQGCTNTYGSLLIPAALGTYTATTSGDMYLVDLAFQLFALSESSFVGSGLFHGRNISDPTAAECYAPIFFTMSAVTPCI